MRSKRRLTVWIGSWRYNMIEIVWSDLETKIALTRSRPHLLIVENPRLYYQIVQQLIRQFEGGEGSFVFLEENEQVDPQKIGEIVVDLFHLHFNDKKVSGLLYKKLEKNFQCEGLFNHLYEINASIDSFLEELFFTTSLSLSNSPMQIADLLKCCNVRVEETYESFLEKVICYINLLIELKNLKIICFVNLKSVFNDEELDQLYRHCCAEGVSLFLVEDTKRRALSDLEKAVIITEDLCEIVENFQDL